MLQVESIQQPQFDNRISAFFTVYCMGDRVNKALASLESHYCKLCVTVCLTVVLYGQGRSICEEFS